MHFRRQSNVTDILDLLDWTLLAKRHDGDEYELEAEYRLLPGACVKLFRDTHAAALVMRERAAQACEELSAEWFPRDKHEAAREGAIMRCAAAVRALEP